jgi:hypothetical protein
MRQRTYFASWVLIFCLLIMGCGNSSDSPADLPTVPPTIGADIVQKFNFNVVSTPDTTNVTLPQQLTGPQWGIIESICQQAGYDLSSYAGQTVYFTKYSITEKWFGPHSVEPLYLWIISNAGQTSICGYLSVGESSSLTPGAFAVNDPSIK